MLCLVLKKNLNFEQLDILADIYAVESSLFVNEESRVVDYVSDIVQVKINLVWRALSKVGQNRGHNRDLNPVSWVLHKSALHSVNSSQS